MYIHIHTGGGIDERIVRPLRTVQCNGNEVASAKPSDDDHHGRTARLRNGAFLAVQLQETLRNGAYPPDPCFLIPDINCTTKRNGNWAKVISARTFCVHEYAHVVRALRVTASMQSTSSFPPAQTDTHEHVFFHLDDAVSLLDGFFATPRCQGTRCVCPFRSPCRNVTVHDVLNWQKSNRESPLITRLTERRGACAVVLTTDSASLNAANAASAIDAADYIIRIGNGPITGYEGRVGRRTTHRVGNAVATNDPSSKDVLSIRTCPPINRFARLPPQILSSCWRTASDGQLRISPRFSEAPTLNATHVATLAAGALCDTVTWYPVPSASRMRSIKPLNTAVALQVSGHLQTNCNFQSVARHLRACRARFTRCDLILHTWSTLVPATPHWQTGTSRRLGFNDSSEACVRKLVDELSPAAVLVEEQPPPPRSDALGPDGLPINGSSKHPWDAVRLHGWRMALLSMARAAMLRLSAGAAINYDKVIRLRPDGRETPTIIATGAQLDGDALDVLWDCVAVAASPDLPKRSASGNDSPSDTLAPFTLRRAIASCNPDANEYQGGLMEDNCFFGSPREMDDVVIEALQHRFAEVYAKMGALGLPQHAQELQFVAALKLFEMRRMHPCREALVSRAAELLGRDRTSGPAPLVSNGTHTPN